VTDRENTRAAELERMSRGKPDLESCHKKTMSKKMQQQKSTCLSVQKRNVLDSDLDGKTKTSAGFGQSPRAEQI
jgi:hypothetical protein